MKNGAIVFLLLFVLALPLISSADTIPAYTDKYVNDFAKIFTEGEILDLRILLSELDQNTTAEVVVVTSSECGLDYDSYAMQIVDKWKIGKADKDNGLLILYCVDMKKIVVKTGYGLEGILPDSKVGRLLDDYYFPLRDLNQTKDGIISVTEQYAQVIYDNKAEVISGQAGSMSANPLGIVISVIVIFLLFGLILYFVSKRDKKKGFGDFWTFFFVDFLVRMIIYSIVFGGRGKSSGQGFGGGGFSGGGGFGGGGFGGGGASR
jgi:uncharacterized protein